MQCSSTNIHRNVLLENMPLYSVALNANGQLWLSGFYEEDCLVLIRAAEQNGLTLSATHARGDWRMLQFTKP